MTKFRKLNLRWSYVSMLLVDISLLLFFLFTLIILIMILCPTYGSVDRYKVLCMDWGRMILFIIYEYTQKLVTTVFRNVSVPLWLLVISYYVVMSVFLAACHQLTLFLKFDYYIASSTNIFHFSLMNLHKLSLTYKWKVWYICSAADEMIDHLKSENEKLHGEVDDLKSELASIRHEWVRFM